MSCDICDPGGHHQTGGFITEADFIAESRRIDSQLAAGAFVADRSDSRETLFHCQACGQRWHLSNPDWAYRGFLKCLPRQRTFLGIKFGR